MKSPEGDSFIHKTISNASAMSTNLFWSFILLVFCLLALPTQGNASTLKFNIVTDEFYGLNAERILLVPVADAADQTVLMTGKCTSRAASDLYLEDGPENAKEKWFVVTENDHIKPDQTICLTGNLPAWFEKTASLR